MESGTAASFPGQLLVKRSLPGRVVEEARKLPKSQRMFCRILVRQETPTKKGFWQGTLNSLGNTIDHRVYYLITDISILTDPRHSSVNNTAFCLLSSTATLNITVVLPKLRSRPCSEITGHHVCGPLQTRLLPPTALGTHHAAACVYQLFVVCLSCLFLCFISYFNKDF